MPPLNLAPREKHERQPDAKAVNPASHLVVSEPSVPEQSATALGVVRGEDDNSDGDMPPLEFIGHYAAASKDECRGDGSESDDSMPPLDCSKPSVVSGTSESL